jgi:pSer/pThr/pTyr-binding forkhead associated (FHA) protein
LGATPWRRTAGGPAAISAVRLSGDLGVFTISLGSSTVGRSPDATVRIDSREVSRIHAIFMVTEADVVVEDRGSVNGTSINGTPITGRRPLVEGDRVSFAHFAFQVELIREGN